MKDRNQQIMDLLLRHGELSVDELAALLNVSSSTIRRDITTLNGRNLVEFTNQRISLSTVINYQPLSIYKLPVDEAESRAIANHAVNLIQQGDVIALSGGQICTQLAIRIKYLKDITVVTNAVNIAVELIGLSDINVMLTGGMINYKSFELVGKSVGLSLKDIRINKFFLGTDGLSLEHGVTAHDEAEALAAREIMGHSGRTVVLADSSKFIKPNFANVAPLSSIDQIITTDLVAERIIDQFKKHGMDVLIAALPKEKLG